MRKALPREPRMVTLYMKWDSEEDMARDVEENQELYEALADDGDDSEE